MIVESFPIEKFLRFSGQVLNNSNEYPLRRKLNSLATIVKQSAGIVHVGASRRSCTVQNKTQRVPSESNKNYLVQAGSRTHVLLLLESCRQA